MKRFYGAGPLHLSVGLAALAVAGWAVAQALDVLASPVNFLIWLGGAIVVHDLLLLPLYSLLGRLAGRAAPGPAAVNHLRVPALLSGLAFVVWFPRILGLDPDVYERASGLSGDVHLERWLLLSATLFACSVVAFAARVLLRR